MLLLVEVIQKQVYPLHSLFPLCQLEKEQSEALEEGWSLNAYTHPYLQPRSFFNL